MKQPKDYCGVPKDDETPSALFVWSVLIAAITLCVTSTIGIVTIVRWVIEALS